MFENLFFYFQFLISLLLFFAASHFGVEMSVLDMVVMTAITMIVISECKYVCEIDVSVSLTIFCPFAFTCIHR